MRDAQRNRNRYVLVGVAQSKDDEPDTKCESRGSRPAKLGSVGPLYLGAPKPDRFGLSLISVRSDRVKPSSLLSARGATPAKPNPSNRQSSSCRGGRWPAIGIRAQGSPPVIPTASRTATSVGLYHRGREP
ncbi:hypothetical protein OPV22_010439 [Ensete ventricosum]|uniref:Uncharacterized protein n=1 Tax=Ensete ventricosum TaxID=4639 RepID=A0AAV8RGT0_ENSVE|nr:hypothetical protein OPV22_010439 [Ensete ventricosum]